jgi:hypothetical protein
VMVMETTVQMAMMTINEVLVIIMMIPLVTVFVQSLAIPS